MTMTRRLAAALCLTAVVWVLAAQADDRRPPTPPSDISRLSPRELFEQRLSATEASSGAPTPARALDDLQALLRDIGRDRVAAPVLDSRRQHGLD